MVKAELDEIAVAGDGSYFLMLLKTEAGDIIPMSIDALQARAIIAGRMQEQFPRPLTHDLILSVLEMLNATLVRIEINDLRDDTYFAKLVLENRGLEFDIDARPSDALALLVRTNVPLLIDESIIEKNAFTEDFGSGGAEA